MLVLVASSFAAGTGGQHEQFLAHLSRHNLVAQRGGRFLTVSSPCSKAEAMTWLIEHYGASRLNQTIALGDSPNDREMLNAADTAIVIRSKHSSSLELDGPETIIHSTLPGPAGWQETMMPLLTQENNNG